MDNIKNLIGEKDFFAREFILWLWYSSDKNDGKFNLDGENLIIFLENKILLEELVGEQSAIIKGKDSAESIEARYALKNGKLIKECIVKILKNIKVGAQDIFFEWSFTFKADKFQITGIKLPNLDEKEFSSRFLKRMEHIEKVHKFVEILYKNFLSIRLNTEVWKNELKDIESWIENVKVG